MQILSRNGHNAGTLLRPISALNLLIFFFLALLISRPLAILILFSGGSPYKLTKGHLYYVVEFLLYLSTLKDYKMSASQGCVNLTVFQFCLTF